MTTPTTYGLDKKALPLARFIGFEPTGCDKWCLYHVRGTGPVHGRYACYSGLGAFAEIYRGPNRVAAKTIRAPTNNEKGANTISPL
jgi:hypothetical protein